MSIISETKSKLTDEQKNDTICLNNYVYHLIDPQDGVVFYVGRGTGRRMFDHERQTRHGRVPHNNRHLFYKIRQVLKRGDSIVYKKIVENVGVYAASEFEISEIKSQRETNPKLTNIGDGGEGGDNITNHPEKDVILPKLRKLHRKMIEKYVKGIPKSDEHKKNLSLVERTDEWNKKVSHTRLTSDANKGVNHYMYGKSWMGWEEWRTKLKENHAEQQGDKNNFYGRHHSEEQRQKWSELRRGKKAINGKLVNI
jgi:hypothetical protein